MPLNYPSNPTTNQTYVENNIVWTYTGSGWSKSVAGTTSVAISDEGTTIANGLTSMNFVGSNVQATASGSAVTVTVTGTGDASGTVPKITNVQVTDSSWTVLDDTAVSTGGGYVRITGTGFVTGCQVVIGSVVATSVSFISSTEVRAQVPAQSAGTYTVYLTNSDGGVAIRVNGLNYSSTPTWTTTSPLPGGVKNTPISIQLLATSNSTVTYTLAQGSTLPSGLTLSSSGLLSGTVTNISVNTTYNFTVIATDSENQDTPQAFSITIVINDPYYGLVTLHLPGTGTNLAQNNTFLDSSSNNFAITRVGNTTQGTFSPFSQTGWGNYFNSNGGINAASSSNWTIGTSVFTVECWIYRTSTANGTIIQNYDNNNGGWSLRFQDFGSAVNGVSFSNTAASKALGFTSTAIPSNTWTHIAAVWAATSGDCTVYINGTAARTITGFGTSTTAQLNIAYQPDQGPGLYWGGYISNLRIVKGQSVYTGNFTPSTTSLTAVSGTVLLTLQSNRLVDTSGTVSSFGTVGTFPPVVAFSPFNPTASWSAATYGGSGYFDGSGDYLNTSYNSAFDFGTGDFTLETWFYLTAAQGNMGFIGSYDGSISVTTGYALRLGSNFVRFLYRAGSSTDIIIDRTVSFNQSSWNHLALVRSSGVLTFYANGTQIGATASVTASINAVSTASYVIGQVSLANYLTGYLSNTRVVKGTAVYTSNFTPPTLPLSTSGSASASAYPSTTNVNTSFASSATSLLLNFTNAGILDATAKNVLETVGDAKISTAQSRWGGSSMLFDGATDYLVEPTSVYFGYGTGNFTIEFWLYLNVTEVQTVFSNLSGTASTNPHIYMNSSTLIYYTTGATRITGSTLSTGIWYHIAVCRASGSTRMFIDGTQTGSTYADTNDYGQSAPLGVGTYWNNGAPATASTLNGYLQDVRVTKYARYTTNFTPPTAAFPTT